jgi:magnesium transporter
MRTITVCRGRSFSSDIAPQRIAEALQSPGSVIWLDVEAPDEDDLRVLRDEFCFHPLAIEDATRVHERPKIDAYEHAILQSPADLDNEPDAAAPGHAQLDHQTYYFLVCYETEFDAETARVRAQPISMFIGSNYLVTVHASPSHNVQSTLARWKAPDSPLGGTIGSLVHALLDAIVDEYFPLMDRVADRVEDLEDTIFERFSEQAIQSIFGLKKDLLNMRRIVAPERDVLNVLLRRELPIFQPVDVAYLQDIYDHIVRVTDNIDTYRDLLSSALDSYLSLQSNNLNQIVKLLTIGSIILMGASLVAGFYGMNFRHMPALDWPIGSLWAVFLMVVFTTGLAFYFKRRAWW